MTKYIIDFADTEKFIKTVVKISWNVALRAIDAGTLIDCIFDIPEFKKELDIDPTPEYIKKTVLTSIRDAEVSEDEFSEDIETTNNVIRVYSQKTWLYISLIKGKEKVRIEYRKDDKLQLNREED